MGLMLSFSSLFDTAIFYGSATLGLFADVCQNATVDVKHVTVNGI